LRGPAAKRGRMGAMVRKILSEAPDHVESEAIGEEALGVYDGGFVAEAKSRLGRILVRKPPPRVTEVSAEVLPKLMRS
jgi:hypothetical protein